MTEVVSFPVSLEVMKPGWLAGGLALAMQVKVVLSTVLRGCKVRVLVKDGLEPDTAEIVTLASLLDKGMFPRIHVTSVSTIVTAVSVAGLMEIVQVRTRGVTLPANSGPGGTVTLTSGVETREYTILSSEVINYTCLAQLTLHTEYFHCRRHQLCLKSWRGQSTITAVSIIMGCSQWVKGQC